MKVTDEHRERAMQLLLPETAKPPFRDEDSRAAAEYLEAVERLTFTEFGNYPTAAMGDTTGTPWDAHADLGHVEVQIAGGDEGCYVVLTPTMARSRAFELLALADIAEAGA